VIKAIAFILSLTLLTGCSSLKLRNIGKSGVTTGIAYATGGVVPAVGVLATAMAYDEIIPDQPSVDQIETEEQAVAYVAESLFMNALYAFIAYLLITLIAVPFIKRWGYNQAKKKYKDVEFKSDMKL
jgi:hypothetical protein